MLLEDGKTGCQILAHYLVYGALNNRLHLSLTQIVIGAQRICGIQHLAVQGRAEEPRKRMLDIADGTT